MFSKAMETLSNSLNGFIKAKRVIPVAITKTKRTDKTFFSVFERIHLKRSKVKIMHCDSKNKLPIAILFIPFKPRKEKISSVIADRIK
jgi:hypothetical protein